jgi:hypothetical protein
MAFIGAWDIGLFAMFVGGSDVSNHMRLRPSAEGSGLVGQGHLLAISWARWLALQVGL